jgi:hypothetical protein
MTRRARLCLALLVGLAGPARPSPAAADPARPIVAIVGRPDDAFVRTVSAELESLGWSSVIVDQESQPPSRAALENAARGAKAIAAIRGVPSEGGVEIWIADRVTGKTVLRQVDAEEGRAGAGTALALRAVELLRASLLETSMRSRPRGEVPPPDEGPSPEDPGRDPVESPPRLRVALGAGPLATPGIGPAAALDVGLAVMPLEHLGIVGFMSVPLSSANLSSPLGTADVTAMPFGGGARLAPRARDATWSPMLEAGVMGAWIKTGGTPTTAGYSGFSVSTVLAGAYGKAGVAVAVTPALRLRLDVLVGGFARRVSIRFAGSELLRWGEPIVLPTLGFDVGVL